MDAPKTTPVLFISMPFETLRLPSIRLGLLAAVCARAGIDAGTRHFSLSAMDVFHRAGGSDGHRITIDDFEFVVSQSRRGLGDWVFGVPPLREPLPEEHDPYLDLLRNADDACRAHLPKLRAMRRLAPAILAQAAKDVLAARPRVIGFSTSFSQTAASLSLARIVKAKDPSIRVIFGGANCEGPMGAALARAFAEIDVVVRGEAEELLPGLLGDLLAERPLTRRPGLCFREAGELVIVPEGGGGPRSMDDVPLPLYDEYFERLATVSFRGEIAGSIALPIETSRGCWWGAKHHCTFCGLNGDTMAFRHKSTERFLDDLLDLSRHHRILSFQAVDNILSNTHLREALPKLRDMGLDLRLFYETKANLKKSEVKLLRDAGVRFIQPGIESFSSVILALMKKGVSGLQNVRLLKWCAQYGVRPGWNLLYGFPGEPPLEYAKMADAMESLTHLPPPDGMSRLSIDRFSPYHQDPRRHGIEVEGPLPHYGRLFPVDEATAAEMAYHFTYRYDDDRDPEGYIGPTRTAVERWRAARASNAVLAYQRGPGFLRIVDQRPNLRQGVFTLGEIESALYLACDSGATPEAVARKVGASGTPIGAEAVKAVLDRLAEKRLLYVEGGKYLSLAIPVDPDERAADEPEDEADPESDRGLSRSDLVSLKRPRDRR